MSGIDIENLEKSLEPLMHAMLMLGQRHVVEKYYDLIAEVKGDSCFKHHRFFWNLARSIDQQRFEGSFTHLEAMRDNVDSCDYDIQKCEQFYEWRKTNSLVV